MILTSGFIAETGEPNALMLLIAYMLMAGAIALYWQFGLSFIMKGRRSDSEAQKSYYQGLGFFLLSVSVGQFIYILDLMVEDTTGNRLFMSPGDYDPAFESLLTADYFIVIFTIILLALAFLMYPVEKYLYARKRSLFTYVVAIFVPAPLVIRYMEINHEMFGWNISKAVVEAENGTFWLTTVTAIWILIIAVGAGGLLYLMKLYIDLGRKSPPGSKLRKKSQTIVWGFIIWLSAIFLTSGIMKEIAKVESDYMPWVEVPAGSFEFFVQQFRGYYLLPLIVPGLLVISLSLMIFGFSRDYD